MFVIPPGFKHGYYMLETLNVYHLLIHTKFFAKYKDELEFLPGYLMLFTIEPVFRKEINFRYFLRLDKNAEDQLLYYSQRIKEESEKDSLETPLMLHTLVLHIIVMLSRLYREQYSIIENKKALHSSFSSIVSSIEYIQENFTKKIAIEDLLKIAYMSRSTYLRLFYKTTGHTPGDYINQYRISKARQMLLENDSTITNIALNTGFCDSSHFSHLFNKYTNMSPTEYRLYFQRF
jgi:AraC-like DNA-binding protein